MSLKLNEEDRASLERLEKSRMKPTLPCSAWPSGYLLPKRRTRRDPKA
jgi:hypothetical protein